MRGADRHRRGRRRAAGLVLGIALATGCHFAPPAPHLPRWTDPGAGVAGIGDDERELWAKSTQGLAELEKTAWLVSDPKVSAYLDDVLVRLMPGALPAGVPQPAVRVVRMVDRQAVAFPNGTILVATSYLSALANEAQLAALLGHELGHFLGRHGLIQQRYAAVSTSTVERMRVARALEEEADETGVVLMRRAGYDPHEMMATLSLTEEDDLAGRGPVFAWESHPYIPDRLKKLRGELGPAPGSPPIGAPDRYEDAIADLLLVAARQELDARRFERARSAIDRHLLARPDSGHGYYLLAEHARLTERDGRRSAVARQNYERAVELAPDDPDAVRALALLYRDEGDMARARPLFATYLRVAPQAPDRKLIERYVGDAPATATTRP